RPGARAERDERVGEEVSERDRQAPDEQNGLQDQPRRVDVIEAERVVPLQLCDQRDDRAGEDEDQGRDAEKPDANPEAPRRARDAELARWLEWTALEGIERPIPPGHGRIRVLGR